MLEDLESIKKMESSENRLCDRLSDTICDYFNEVIPSREEWERSSDMEKEESWNIVESRMQEVMELTNARDADMAELLPQYILQYSLESLSPFDATEFPFCDEYEFDSRCEWAVKEFEEREQIRDIPYAEADTSLREEYILDFYSQISEFSGYNADLEFIEMESPHDLGAYDPEENRITLNSNLLESDSPTKLMETLLHETRHAFQRYAVDYPDLVSVAEDTIAVWKDNFDYYIRPEWDYEAYVNQPVEADADAFAEKMFAQYLS